MGAKGKQTKAKTTRKQSQPTAVSEVIKAKKKVVKATKKSAQKKPAPKATRKVKAVVTVAEFERWFYDQPSNIFVQLTETWNEKNLKVRLKKQQDYDHWFDYFKTLPPATIRLLFRTGQNNLPTEAYAALSRWVDIISNPARIDKIHQAAMLRPKTTKDGILAMARSNDRLGVLRATRDQLAEKIEKGAGARDTAALARELTEVMTQIAEFEKRLGPKKETVLGNLLHDMPVAPKKRPAHNGSGARHTSFKSRITIEDLEG